MKKPLKTSSKTAVKKTSTKSSAKAKVAAPAKKLIKPAPTKSAKPVAKKAVTKAPSAVKKAAAKPAPKPASKAAPKAAVKPAVKPVAKVAAKPATKPASKVAAKSVTKAAAKPAAKAATKPTAKPASKTTAKAVKPVAKSAKSAKPAPKVMAKPVAKAVKKPTATPVAKTTTKSAVKPAVKPVAKPAAKPAAKAPAQVLSKAPVKTPAKASAKAVAPAAEKATKVPTPVAAPVLATPVPTGDVPARAVRPSARLAQITVPSMAQSVASTAAKASYLQNMPSPVINPPHFVAVKKDPKLANNWKTKKPDQLTDAEIMAMSDNDYMNDAQMAFFRHKLVLLKQGILANAGETTEHLREDTVVVPDPADRATIEEEHALELRTRDRERKLLKKIEQSIQRIDAGDYGYCDETGEPIGVGRLLARPTASLSLEAQQRRELKQKMFGD